MPINIKEQNTHHVLNLRTRPEAAAVLGVKPRTLAQWAYQGHGPVICYLGRSAYYSDEALAAYVKQCTVDPADLHG